MTVLGLVWQEAWLLTFVVSLASIVAVWFPLTKGTALAWRARRATGRGGEDERRADTLVDACEQQPVKLRRQCTTKMRDCAPRQAEQEYAPVPEHVACAPEHQRQARISEHVHDDDPADIGNGARKGADDGRERGVDGRIQRPQRRTERNAQERKPRR